LLRRIAQSQSAFVLPFVASLSYVSLMAFEGMIVFGLSGSESDDASVNDFN